MNWVMTTGRARILAAPSEVWKWVCEPRGWVAWNPKMEEVIPFSADAPGLGWRCRISYRIRKKRTQLADAELVEFVPNEKLVCRTTGGDLKPGGWILETYLLHADEGTTVVTHTVDLGHSKMPYLSRVLVVVLTGLFNSGADLGHVRNLKALMEDGVPPPSSKG